MDQGLQQSVPTPETPDYSVPWKAVDNWLGVALLVVIDAILIVVVLQGLGAQLAQSAGRKILQGIYRGGRLSL